MKLYSDCSKSLHDYGKETCLAYGPGDPMMVLYLFSATAVLDILVTADLVLPVHLSVTCSTWISFEILHVSCPFSMF